MRRVLFGYSLIGSLLSLAWIVQIAFSSQSAADALTAARTRLSEASTVLDANTRLLAQLEGQQRELRANAPAEMAVGISIEVQSVQKSLEVASADRQTAEIEAIRAERFHRAMLLRLVPAISMLLLHLVACTYFFSGGTRSRLPLG